MPNNHTYDVDGEQVTVTTKPEGLLMKVGENAPRVIPWAEIAALPVAYMVTCDGWEHRICATFKEASDRVSDLRAVGAVATIVRLSRLLPG